MKEVIALRERKLTRTMCHHQTFKISLAESNILAKLMKLINPTARV